MLNANPITFENGKASWTHENGDKYVVTGVTTTGKRFKQVHDSWRWASMINLWRGTKWLLRGGRRFRIQTSWN